MRDFLKKTVLTAAALACVYAARPAEAKTGLVLIHGKGSVNLATVAESRAYLSVSAIQDVVAAALGGEMVTTTVEGRERFGVIVRFPRELRDSPGRIAREVLIATMDGAQIPLGELAHVGLSQGAPSIRTENALLSAYIYVDLRGRDIGSYVRDAQQAVAEQVSFPPGTYATWSGQFEYMQRAKATMKVVIPLTLGIIFLLLYLNFRRVTESLIVMFSVPFALVGGVWLMWALQYNLSGGDLRRGIGRQGAGTTSREHGSLTRHWCGRRRLRPGQCPS